MCVCGVEVILAVCVCVCVCGVEVILAVCVCVWSKHCMHVCSIKVLVCCGFVV